MNMYILLAIYLLSSAIILVCLDHLKMRIARNLFLALTVVLIAFLPFVVHGNQIIYFRSDHQMDSLADKSLALIEQIYLISGDTLMAVSLIFSVLAVIVSVSTVILIVHTARAICKLVAKIKEKRQHPKVPQKQTFERKFAQSKIQYKRILYLRFCRLNS